MFHKAACRCMYSSTLELLITQLVSRERIKPCVSTLILTKATQTIFKYKQFPRVGMKDTIMHYLPDPGPKQILVTKKIGKLKTSLLSIQYVVFFRGTVPFKNILSFIPLIAVK